MSDAVFQPAGFGSAPFANETKSLNLQTGMSAATRYLAAAAFTDTSFRNDVIALDKDEYRARAPELGIDGPKIIRECYRARRQRLIRSWLLLPILLIGVVAISALYGDPAVLRASQPPPQIYLLSALWGAAAIILFIETYIREHVVLTREFGPHTVVPRPQTGLQSAAQNLVVYGGFSPFVGSGNNLGGWSFTVNLERGKADARPVPFEIETLYVAIRQGFERLKIEGLSVQDRLYVDGKAIRNDKRFLPDEFDRPVATVDPKLIEALRHESAKRVRHYLSAEISDWSGEVVLSVFIRFQKTESKLFVEATYFLLPPLKAEYYAIDSRTPTQMFGKVMHWLVAAILTAPVYALFAPVAVWSAISGALHNKGRQQRREIKRNPLYNYGAVRSIRERGNANAWRVYFQKLDHEMHSKVLQQQLLDVLIEFLESHDIDTSEIKDRGSHILNNGVIVSGGSITAESLAVGAKAQAHSRARSEGGASQ